MGRIHSVAHGELGTALRENRIVGVVVEHVKPESPSHYPFAALAAMYSGVACRAQRNQVFFCVFARMAAEFLVVHLQIRHRATGLTPPAVPTQDLLTQTSVRQGVQPRGSGLGADHSQEAFSRRFSRNACCCSPGKNL